MQPKYQADMRDDPLVAAAGRGSKDLYGEYVSEVRDPQLVANRRFQEIRLEAAKKALADAIPGIGEPEKFRELMQGPEAYRRRKDED